MSEADNLKFDDVYLGILQHCGKIEPFLDTVFNFLSRRTDFYHMMHKKDDKLGFPPGIAEKMLIKIFRKYQERVLIKDPIYMRWKESGGKDSGEMWQTAPAKVEEVVDHEEEVVTDDSAKKEMTDDSKKSCDQGDASKQQSIPKTGGPSRSEKPCSSTKDEKPSSSIKDNEKSCSPTKDNMKSSSSTKDDVKSSSSTKDTIDNDCFNGGKTDKYSWSQTISDVDLKVPIPSFVTKSKDLSIDIQSHNVSVSLKNNPPPDCGLASKLLLTGKLKEKIKCDESLWSLVPGKYVEINLEKFAQKWWDGVLEGDVEIDRTSIDTTQHVHDFDERTQSDIRKVMYDQQQKLLGKPTSDEQKTHGMLEKAWDAEGSPFKGTPFDPSKLNIAT